MTIIKRFPLGLKKCVTFSYDDGIEQDRRLVELFNQYNLKASFNLNSEIMSENHKWIANDQYEIVRINKQDVVELYDGHEAVSHSCYHHRLDELDDESILNDLRCDQKNLSDLFNYPISGFVAPFYYFDRLDPIVKEVGFSFIRKRLDTSQMYCIKDGICYFNDYLHHNHSGLDSIVDQFINDCRNELSVLYIWGHSYEFDLDQNWDHMDALCSHLSNKKEIYYATNGELARYLLNLELLSEKDGVVQNYSNQTLWFEYKGCISSIPPKTCIQFN